MATTRAGWPAVVVHIALVCTFTSVWLWHLTPKANEQEVAHKFGWFTRYLTFYSFSLQLVQLWVCLLADLSGSLKLTKWADDLSCTSFPVAVFVTGSYYYLLLTGSLADEKGVPAWVSPALHTGNTIGSLLDMMVSLRNRTFSGRALRLVRILVLLYLVWMAVCRYMSGAFPYAFMDDLPQPQGYLGVAAALLIAEEALFRAARLFQRRIIKPKLSAAKLK